jgi:hypothetical protein
MFFRTIPLVAVSLLGIALVGGLVTAQEPIQQQSPNTNDPNQGVVGTTTTTTTPAVTQPTQGTTGETSPSPTTPDNPDGMPPTTHPAPGTTPAPMVVESDSTGQILIRGIVETIEPNRMIIHSWGGRWTIRTSGASRVIPAATSGVAGDLSTISIGHFVGVDGKTATDAQLTVDAKLVRDWTTHPYPGAFANTDTGAEGTREQGSSGDDSPSATGEAGPTDDNQDQNSDNNSSLEFPSIPNGTTSSPADIQTTPSAATDVSATPGETYRGRVESVGDNTFILNPSALFARNRTVEVSAATLITDENSNLAPFVAIKDDDEVQVEGSLTDDGTIRATTIRLERTNLSETGANTTTDNL